MRRRFCRAVLCSPDFVVGHLVGSKDLVVVDSKNLAVADSNNLVAVDSRILVVVGSKNLVEGVGSQNQVVFVVI